MPKKVKQLPTVIEAAQEAAREAKTANELRMAQTVLIPGILNAADNLTGEIVGRSRPTVVRLRKIFCESLSGQGSQGRNWGGRRYGYMTIEDERQFLSGYLDQASRGGILVVSEIQRAFESQVGRKVAPSTIYRMLDRHDWRTIIPRPRHPKSDTEAQEDFKKTPENGN